MMLDPRAGCSIPTVLVGKVQCSVTPDGSETPAVDCRPAVEVSVKVISLEHSTAKLDFIMPWLHVLLHPRAIGEGGDGKEVLDSLTGDDTAGYFVVAIQYDAIGGVFAYSQHTARLLHKEGEFW